MSRAKRLLDLIQLLREHRAPVSGQRLAEGMGVSIRTIYRDIATLQEQGARIEGEPGLGYVLRPGFLLPPLMFSEEEIEALVLGSRWVAKRGDARIGEAARRALSKITAVLPKDLRYEAEEPGLLVGAGEEIAAGDAELPTIRQAIRAERKLEIAYRDLRGEDSARVIWPFALAFFDKVRVVVGWCELREDFRAFRTDRITALTATETRYPRRRREMLKAWREREGVPLP